MALQVLLDPDIVPSVTSAYAVTELHNSSRLKQLDASFFWPHALPGILTGLGSLPLILKFFDGLTDRPQYEFYPLLLIAAAWLAWDRLMLHRSGFQAGSRLIAAPLIASGLLLLVVGTALYVRWLALPAMLLLLAGIVWQMGGNGLFKTLTPCFILLLTLLPPPGRYDQVFLTELQRFAVVCSSRLLDLFNIPNLVSGTTIEIPGHRLLVEQGCSGINSVVSISAFTLLYAFIQRRGPVRIVLLLITAVTLILLVNLIRIVLGAILLTRGIDLLEPSVHAAVSFVMFILGLGFTLSADQLFELVGDLLPRKWRNEPKSLANSAKTGFASAASSITSASAPLRMLENRQNEATADELNLAKRSQTRPAIASQNWQNEATTTITESAKRSQNELHATDQNRQNEATTPAAHFTKRTQLVDWLSIGFAVLSLTIGAWSYLRVRDCWPVSHLSGGALFAPPSQVGPWQLVDGAGGATQRIESVARYQQRWVYRAGDTVAEVSFAYPFNALYHDAAECYQYTGWQVVNRSFSHDDHGVLNTVSLLKPGEARGFMVFGAFDEAGRPDLPPTRDLSRGPVATALVFSREAALHRPSCEVQTLQVSTALLDDRQQAQLRELFSAVRDELKQQTLARAAS